MISTKVSKPTLVNIVLLAGFTVYYLMQLNSEFIIYVVTISAMIYLIEKTDRVFNLAGVIPAIAVAARTRK